MTYELQFLPSALKEWKKLGAPVQRQFKKKLAERLETPHVPADRLHGLDQHYKIKLRSAGYRLVYSVQETTITVTVIAVGKRERGQVYKDARSRSADQ
jgi:mRNA interferase RelE/StbE